MFADKFDIANGAFETHAGSKKYQIMQTRFPFILSFSVFKRGDARAELEAHKTGHFDLWQPHNVNRWTRSMNSTLTWYSHCIYLDQILTGYRYSFPFLNHSMHADIADRLHLACFSYVQLWNPPPIEALIFEQQAAHNRGIEKFYKDVCNAIIVRDKPTVLYNLILSFKSRCEANSEIYCSTLMMWIFSKHFRLLKAEFEDLIPYARLIYAEDFQMLLGNTKKWRWIRRLLANHLVGHDLAQLIMKKYACALAQDKINLQLKNMEYLID